MELGFSSRVWTIGSLKFQTHPPADINFHVLHVFGDFGPRQKVFFFENVGFSSTARDGDLEKADPLRHFPGRASLEDWLCLARLGWLWCNGFKTGHLDNAGLTPRYTDDRWDPVEGLWADD